MNNFKYFVYLLVFFLGSINYTIAQQTVLSGVIAVGKSSYMKYQINYQLDKKNNITGYSISDLNGSEETKAKIIGVFNQKKRTMVFEEVEIISTKSRTPIDEFCLMRVKGKFHKKSGKYIYTGEFDSYCRNPKVACDSGTAVLMTEKDIKELSTKVVKAVQKAPIADSVKRVLESAPDTTKWVRKVYDLQANSETEIKLNADFVILELVDDRFQDGDKVTIMENDKVILQDFELTNQVKTIKFLIDRDMQKLTVSIFAADEGSIALTTVKAVLKNGKESNLINANLNKGQHIKLAIVK